MQKGNSSSFQKQSSQFIRRCLTKQIPNIQCPSQNQIVYLCLNPKCKNCPRCAIKQCQFCGSSVHSECSQMISMEQLTALVNQRAKVWEKLLTDVFNAEEQLILKIRKEQRQFIEKFLDCQLEDSDFRTFRKIYRNKSVSNISGEEGIKFVQKLQSKFLKNVMKQFKDRRDTYLVELYRFSIRLSKFKQGCFFPPKKEQNQLSIDSKVLEMKGTVTQDLSFLSQKLGHPSSLKLIFRASQNQFSATAFHYYCNNTSDTLVLARTQFGKTIAGYSHYKWGKLTEKKADKKNGWVNDHERRAFLLQLDRKEKIVPQADEGLICCDDQKGPFFGLWGAFSIGDKCHALPNSSTEGIGFRFNREGYNNQYPRNSQQTWKAISGATTGPMFRVQQYEVFSIHWEGQNQNKFMESLRLTVERVEEQYQERKRRGNITQWQRRWK